MHVSMMSQFCHGRTDKAILGVGYCSLLKDEGDGCDGAGNDVDGDHPITECSGVQWLDGLGGQV